METTISQEEEKEEVCNDYTEALCEYPVEILHKSKHLTWVSRWIFFDHVRAAHARTGGLSNADAENHPPKHTRDSVRQACRNAYRSIVLQRRKHRPVTEVASAAVAVVLTAKNPTPVSCCLGEPLDENRVSKGANDGVIQTGLAHIQALASAMMQAYIADGFRVENERVETAAIAGKIFDVARKAAAVIAGLSSVLPQLALSAALAFVTGGSMSVFDIVAAASKAVENTRRTYAALYKYDKSLPKGLYALDTAKDINNALFLTLALWSGAYYTMYLAYMVNDTVFAALKKKKIGMDTAGFARCQKMRNRVQKLYEGEQYLLIPSAYATMQSAMKLKLVKITKTSDESKRHTLDLRDGMEKAAFGYITSHILHKQPRRGCTFPFIDEAHVRLVASKSDDREIAVTHGRDTDVFKYPLKKTGYVPEPGWERLADKGVVKLLPYHSLKTPNEDITFVDWCDTRLLRHQGSEFALFSRDFMTNSGKMRIKQDKARLRELKDKEKELGKNAVDTRRAFKEKNKKN